MIQMATDQNIKNKKAWINIFVPLFMGFIGIIPAFSHSPIFMPAAESHGAHAFDLHFSVHRMGSSYELEQMWGFGLYRNLSVSIGAGSPFNDGKFGHFENVMLGGSWIFWSRDKFQAKQALAFQMSAHFHADREDGTRQLSLGRTFPAALAYSLERRYWTLFASARALPRGVVTSGGGHGSEGAMQGHQMSAQHLGSGAGTTSSASTSHDGLEAKYTGWGDLGYAHRLVDIAKREIDMMIFLGTSARFGSHFAQYLSPELWIGPNGRMLFKVGYQFPIVLHNDDEDKGGQWAYAVEIRF